MSQFIFHLKKINNRDLSLLTVASVPLVPGAGLGAMLAGGALGSGIGLSESQRPCYFLVPLLGSWVHLHVFIQRTCFEVCSGDQERQGTVSLLPS